MPNPLMRFESLSIGGKFHWIERTIPGIVFVLLGLWTYALFVHVPYAGFDFNPSDGEVTVLYDLPPDAELQVGDRLRQVGLISWDAFDNNLSQRFFVNQQQGEVVPLRIQRGEQELAIEWGYPGFTIRQFWARLDSEWWLAYIFWLAGTLTWLLLRPKDERWQLLVAFNFLTALWLAGGSMLSRWHIWAGSIKLGFFIWLSVPVYLNLHWTFPRSLGTIPPPLWWLTYLVAGGLAMSELFQILPQKAYFWGFSLGVGGSGCLLLLHIAYQPRHRREIILLATAAALALLPALAVGIVGLVSRMPTYAGLALLSMPALPLAYFYAAARQQLGDLEIRANRLISLYIFLILLGTATLILVPLAHAWFSVPVEPIGITQVAVLLTALLSVMGFTRFERWIEWHLLAMPLPPTELLENYASQITTTLTLSSLISLLDHKILPSLLVRQALLLKVDEHGKSSVLSQFGLDEQELPSDDDYAELLAQTNNHSTRIPWVRVLLPLQIGQQPIGFWLLGRRDPDDFYAQAEIAILKAIANQTAIALTNIMQAKQLRTLYQTSIERDENERTRLAHELHDVVLNDLAALYTSVEGEQPPSFEKNYGQLKAHIRKLIKGLRIAALSPGSLRTALDELVKELNERQENGPACEIERLADHNRYPPLVEQHLFRIVQQACENALRHAQAKSIRITGTLNATQVQLTVQDNGIGFETAQTLELSDLLLQQHFGIVGMLERAKLIGARLQIDSQPNKGTQVHLSWEQPDEEPSPRPSPNNGRGRNFPN